MDRESAIHQKYELLESMFEFALQSLNKRKEFHPFAEAITEDGRKLAFMSIVSSDGEYVDGNAMIADLVEQLRRTADEESLVACGICYDVKLTEPIGKFEDAAVIRFESATLGAQLVYQPYRFNWLRRFDLFVDEVEGFPQQPTDHHIIG